MKSFEKDGMYAIIKTNKGEIALELFYKQTPLTVLNFVGLSTGKFSAAKGKPFYNGLKFHRVIEDFMIQGGDPKGTGAGGPGYNFVDEFVDELIFDKPGKLAMANAGPNTNGSQFFITHVPTDWLNHKHTIFGQVVASEDQDVVNKIKQGDIIESVEIICVGSDAESFEISQEKFEQMNKSIEEENKKKIRERIQKLLAPKIKEVEEKYPNAQKDENGIYFEINSEGQGDKVGAGKHVWVDYKGLLVSGKVFDQSYGRGPLDFTTDGGQMIPGFDIMVQDMKLNEKRTIIIPPQLGYGMQGYPGVIPPASFLVFEIELKKVK